MLCCTLLLVGEVSERVRKKPAQNATSAQNKQATIRYIRKAWKKKFSGIIGEIEKKIYTIKS